MKISLVIPAHNEEKYIKDCLESVVANSNGRLHEIIVIDNASTDATTAIAQSVPGVRVVFEPRKGLTQARQRGFLEATGDIVAYIDADTRKPKGWSARIHEEFSKNPNLVCLSGPYIYHDISAWQKFLVRLYWLFIAVPMYTLVGYMAIGGNFAIRRNTLEKMKGFDTTISFYGEDTNIARRASEFGKVKFTLDLPMYTSGRRFKGQGLWKTSMMYMANFVSEVFMHRQVTKSYKDIR